jgi:putative spermidine/putrescine transport system substrate-binding protein
MVLMLVAAACGEAATPEPTEVMEEVMEEQVEEEVEEAMEEEVMEEQPGDEVMEEEVMEEQPGDGLRPLDQWTVENPATLAEIEAELENYRGESFVFISWGGAYQAAQRQAFIVPFEDQFGIDVIEETVPTAAKIRAQAETGNILWHVMDWGSSGIWQFGPSGDVEELDFSIIDDRGNLEVERSPWTGGGGITWSEVLAYNTETYPEGLPDMSAYYDTERYPGRRGWAYYPDPELIFTLLGENPSLLDTSEGRASLGTLDDDKLERAYELFNQHKDQVSLFWQTGSDCPQLLISGELDMCTAWNGRIYDAAKEGAPIAICWHCGHVLHAESFMIIKGLAEEDPRKFTLAQLFLAWTSFPERNAQLSRYISYGPLNVKSLPFLDAPEFDEVRAELPTSAANIQYAIFFNNKWWGENTDTNYEQYLEWQQGL